MSVFSGIYLLPCLFALLIGGLIGLVELIQRYPEPKLYPKSLWAYAYVGFNAFISLGGFIVLQLSLEPDSSLSEQKELLLQLKNALLAGFGSLGILRAKFISLTGKDGKDIALGPEIIIQSFLGVIDREFDRYQALKRLETIRDNMKDIDFDKSYVGLPYEITLAMKRIEKEENDELTSNLENIKKLPLSSKVKSYLMAYYILDLTGESFFKQAIKKVINEGDYKPEPNTIDETQESMSVEIEDLVQGLSPQLFLDFAINYLSNTLPNDDLDRFKFIAKTPVPDPQKPYFIAELMMNYIPFDQLKALIEENREQLK